MKLLFITFFVLSYSINSFSQVEEKHLIGNWYHIKTERVSKEITLEKTKKDYGISLSLRNDNSIREHYSAPCGNDMQFFRSANKGVGKWSYNSKTHILTSSIPLLYASKKFKLISYKDNRIVLSSLPIK